MNGDASCLQLTEHVSGNIFIRPVTGNKGYLTGGHTHNFDHTMIVVEGSVFLVINYPGEEERIIALSAGQWLLVRALGHHRIVMLETPTRYLCVYSHRDAQGEVVQTYNGPHPEAPGSDPAYQ